MARTTKQKKSAGAVPVRPVVRFSSEAQELRLLLRRVPDGYQATLRALATQAPDARERVLGELARGLGKEILPLLRGAALSPDDSLALSAIRVLAVFGTRSAGEVLVEVFQAHPEGERASAVRQSARALEAVGVRVPLPAARMAEEQRRFTLRETYVSLPDAVGARTVAARLQDAYGVWYSILVLWDENSGILDGFMRPFSRHEWVERMAEEVGLRWVECPPDYARWLVALGRARGIRARGRAVSAEWDRWVGPPPEGYEPPEPPEVELSDDLSTALRQIHERAAALLDREDVPPWGLDMEQIREPTRRFVDLLNRYRLRGPDESKEDLVDELVRLLRGVVDSARDEQNVTRYRQRLYELACAYHWAGEPEPARWASCQKAALEQGHSGLTFSFFWELTVRSILRAAKELRGGKPLADLPPLLFSFEPPEGEGWPPLSRPDSTS